LKLPQNKRHFLKNPLGSLFEGSDSAFDYLNSIDYEWLVTVGDFTTADFLNSGFEIDILIVDFLIERAPAKEDKKDVIEKYSAPSVEVENPRGCITEELWNVLTDVDCPLKVYVDGEEDLATLPAVLLSPPDSIVAYGQPGEGVVLVEVDESKKNEFKRYIEFFEGSQNFLERI